MFCYCITVQLAIMYEGHLSSVSEQIGRKFQQTFNYIMTDWFTRYWRSIQNFQLILIWLKSIIPIKSCDESNIDPETAYSSSMCFTAGKTNPNLLTCTFQSRNLTKHMHNFSLNVLVINHNFWYKWGILSQLVHLYQLYFALDSCWNMALYCGFKVNRGSILLSHKKLGVWCWWTDSFIHSYTSILYHAKSELVPSWPLTCLPPSY